MIYHVLAGDSLASEFNKTNIDGEVIVCRDAFVVGPVDAVTPFEFWDQRARFILAEYGEDEIVFHERVADEIEKLRDAARGEEVNLWFEYELFCSVNMWFCLSLLRETGASVYRVEPAGLDYEDRWKGFGSFDAAGLQASFEARTKLSDEEIRLGTDLWNAFRNKDHVRLADLSETKTKCFPYLKEVCSAAIEQETKPVRIVNEIIAGGMTEFKDVFPEFSKRAGVYGFGDTQVERIFNQLS